MPYLVAVVLAALGFVGALAVLAGLINPSAPDPVARAQLAVAALLAGIVAGGLLGGAWQLVHIARELRARRRQTPGDQASSR